MNLDKNTFQTGSVDPGSLEDFKAGIKEFYNNLKEKTPLIYLNIPSTDPLSDNGRRRKIDIEEFNLKNILDFYNDFLGNIEYCKTNILEITKGILNSDDGSFEAKTPLLKNDEIYFEIDSDCYKVEISHQMNPTSSKTLNKSRSKIIKIGKLTPGLYDFKFECLNELEQILQKKIISGIRVENEN